MTAVVQFDAVVRSGHKEDAVEVPFDPSERWNIAAQQLWPGRRGFPVVGSLNDVQFEGVIVPRMGSFWLLLSPETEELAGVAEGDCISVKIAPNNSFKPNPLRGSA